MKSVAFGLLSLKPDQFWALTLDEFLDLIEGYKARERAEYEKLAQLAVWVTAPHLKRPLSVDQLIKPETAKGGKKVSAEERQAELEELEREMG